MNDEELLQVSDVNSQNTHLWLSTPKAKQTSVFAGSNIKIIVPQAGEYPIGLISLVNQQKVAQGDIEFVGQFLHNQGPLERLEGQIIERFPGGSIISENNVIVNIENQIYNARDQSLIQAKNNISIKTNKLENYQKILSDNYINITSDELNNPNFQIADQFIQPRDGNKCIPDLRKLQMHKGTALAMFINLGYVSKSPIIISAAKKFEVATQSKSKYATMRDLDLLLSFIAAEQEDN
ncbi:MAG: hypothetical protein EZS28_009160 [Streblomastix strix]|uniref:Uncharacterized protein n=1 Tax=Streblomastix strix TaxID=222440 RepID=A0A5J4WK48_9EUKA|nr:MAG: hypothetical protein EZS28_009160 [Streblomastix strix]